MSQSSANPGSVTHTAIETLCCLHCLQVCVLMSYPQPRSCHGDSCDSFTQRLPPPPTVSQAQACWGRQKEDRCVYSEAGRDETGSSQRQRRWTSQGPYWRCAKWVAADPRSLLNPASAFKSHPPTCGLRLGVGRVRSLDPM